MGQRLVVTIKDKGEDKMKIYYHWSAYTGATFEELNDLWGAIKPLKRAGKSTEEILLGIIRYLEGNVDEAHRAWLQKNYPEQLRSCHGGIGYYNKNNKLGLEDNMPNEELAYIQKLYPGETFSTDVDRNNGLVHMSPDGMADVQSWSEGDAWIDISSEQYSNDIHWCYHGKDEYIAEKAYEYSGGETSDQDKDEVDELASEFDNLSVYNGDGSTLFSGNCDDIFKNWCTWDKLTGTVGGTFRDTNDTVWEGLV